MQGHKTGVARRLVATGAAVAVAAAGLVAGTVTAAHAAPVNVTTSLTDLAGNVLDGRVTAYLQDAEGRFSSVASQNVADGVVNLPVEPGTYKFEFRDDAGLYVAEFYNDKATLEAADAVAVAGPTALAAVSLAPAPTLRGQVVGPTGKPLEWATVTIYKAEDGTSFRSVNSRRDGTFAVGLTPGNYKVKISASSMASEFYNNKATIEAADLVGVGAGGADIGTITMSKGAVVTGRITSDAGVPLERAEAVLVTPAGSQIGADLTDSAGIYRIEGVPAGTYKVHFIDRIEEFKSEWLSDQATIETADPITVGLKQVVSGIDASLAPDPNAIDPAKVDVSGLVVDSAGAPVIGAVVRAYDTPAGSDEEKQVDYAVANRAGRYAFTRLDLAETSEDAFKVQAIDSLGREEGQYLRLPRWFGGSQSYASANVVNVPLSGVDITLPLTGGISGKITSESGLPVDGVSVELLSADGTTSGYRSTRPKDDGTYLDTAVVPGTYKVRFVDAAAGYASGKAHAPEWYDNTVFAKAKLVTITSGATTSGIDAALNSSLRALRAPAILGKPYLKGKVRATPGEWSVETGTTFLYRWLVGTTVIGTGPTLKIPKSAKNKRVSLEVSASNNGLDGTAMVSTQVIKKKPKVRIKVKGKSAFVTVSGKKVKSKKIKGAVVVKRLVGTNDLGVPRYTKVGKGKLVKGKARVALKRLKKGKNKLVFVITFKGGPLGDATVAKTIKVKR